MPNSKISENAQKKKMDLSDANNALISPNRFAEQMEEIIKTPVCALAEETAKNTVKENALKKKAVLDVLEFCPLSAVKEELLMITSVIWSVHKINF